METYKIIIEYDGTRYGGFKKTKRGGTVSIQEKIETVLSRMEHGENFIMTAAVNTEPGVHSLGQTISYGTHQRFDAGTIKQYMNQYLPMDIVVREVKLAREGFHAEVAKSFKRYQYRMQTGNYKNVMEQAYMDYEPEGPDLSAIRNGMKLLSGTNDFIVFNNNPRLKKSTIRTIDKLQMKVDRQEINIYCQIDQVWPGLIPSIFGTLLQVGQHKLDLEELKRKLKEKQMGSLSIWAPTKAILLQKVLYE